MGRGGEGGGEVERSEGKGRRGARERGEERRKRKMSAQREERGVE